MTMHSAVYRFRALHQSACFVMPNPWDVGSAVYLQHLGFAALATSSAGFAFSHGLPDAVGAQSREDVLAHVRDIVTATPLPVNADFQDGYGDDPAGVADSVAACVATGAAGLSIEDATGVPGAPLYERGVALERLRAARSAIDASGVPVVLTARCEAWLVGAPDADRVVLDRMVAYADAGADCLFAPGVRDPDIIATLVRAVSPRPLNVLVSAPGLSVSQLADLGVRRISVGSGLARAAWGGFVRAARELVDAGTFGGFAGATPHGELDDLFRRRRGG